MNRAIVRTLAPALCILVISGTGLAGTPTDPLPWEDESCDFAKTDPKLAPEALVRAYVARDGRGEFLRSDPWFRQAVLCPGHVGGRDTFDVVLGATIAKVDATRNAATFRVEYRHLGTISRDETGRRNAFLEDRKLVTQTIRAVSTPYGWKLENPSYGWVLPAAARKLTAKEPWTEGERRKLERAIASHR